ncbi:MAG TPA: NTP transferase domain-containing protein [Candidatus Omnitrophota bacterium]|nr:NTP transferase domain-containing protein [Candidatus Omnitrophota bacterium]HPT07214.1 NTP transferase domain-containing protein [Candidatus Omnitrophota bacterium]
MSKKLAIVILAAGKSTRMKSELPKVLHPICGRPVLAYVLDLVKQLKPARSIAVLGYKHEEVRAILPAGMTAVVQKKLIGTADAVKQAHRALAGFKGTVLILYGDCPLLKVETVKKLLVSHTKAGVAATLLSAYLEEPASYGRIVRDRYAGVSGIVEAKDANDAQKLIREINTGVVCYDKDKLFKALAKVRPHNAKKEYYLTDTIDILYKSGELIDAVKIGDINEALGINSRVELAQASKIIQKRINEKIMLDGVTLVDPETAYINYGTKIGQDTVIYPFTVIENDVIIKKRCSVGPFIHLRPATRLEDDVVVGNFLEIVRSKISSKTWAKHFGYIGDTRIGKSANIGAGSVTANFDNNQKNVSVIKDNAFIGCDTVLVSPVVVGKGAKTGAGSIVTKHTKIADYTVVAGVPARPLAQKRV